MLAVVVPATLISPVAARAVGDPAWHTAQEQRPVPGHELKARAPIADPGAKYDLTGAPPVTWPSPGTALVRLPATGTPDPAGTDGDGARTGAADSGKARAGDLPVWLGPATQKGGRDPVEGAGSSRSATLAAAPAMRVTTLDPRTWEIAGLGLRLTPQAAPSGPARMAVEVDYSGFRYAYGGDWGSRLRLVRLPECAATTPDRAECQTRTPLATRNDVKTGRLSADVEFASAAPMTLAAVAAPSGSAGTYEATSLSPSATWNVGNQSGAFSWSYPLRLPPAPGGPTPNIGFAYSSGSVDGRTVASNNQASWIGEGFDYSPGFIERRYKQCAEDGVTPKRGDQCWRYDNATMSLNGQATELVRDDATGTWQPQNDDGAKVEKLGGADNGDNDGEHWRVTSPDGTQYYFGLNHLPGWATGKAETQSTWTVPIFGNNDGEPCHKDSGFSDSWCQQAWRWNLDYVVDPHGTVSTFWYTPESNYYRRDVTTLTNGEPNGTPTRYTRGGYLKRADYGQRSTTVYTASAPARVVFDTGERCIPTSAFDCAEGKFTKDNAKYWPDVPYDQKCDSGEKCLDNYSPTFWTRKRLTGVTTQVLVSGSTYKDVDTWTLDQEMRAPGDGTAAGLWLASIQHTGKAGGSATLPPVRFAGVQKPNRVDALEGRPPLTKWRVSAIDNETGGALSITYSGADCTAGNTPEPDTNTRRCYPQYWSPEGATEPIRDWFHKYVVTQVQQIDRTGGAPDVVDTYEYLGGGAWHHDDDDGLTKEKYKTWSQWRGYGKVRVLHGAPTGQRSQAEFTYFRGMDGDELSGGGTRHVTVTDSEGAAVADAEALQGQTREQIHYDGPGGAEKMGEITGYWVRQTGKRVRSWGTATASMVLVDKVRSRAALAAGGWRRTSSDTDYNTDGLITQISDLGDESTAADDQCVRTTYARDDARWMISYASRVETVSKACSATPSRPGDVLSDMRKYYDGKAFGAAPSKGDVTKTEKLGSWNGGPQYVTLGSTTFDAYGRPLVVTDSAGGTTTTAYTPATGLVTGTQETNPAGHVTRTEVEPAWGLATAAIDVNGKRSDLAYDPLGRLTGVWLPGRAKATYATTPNMRFGYQIRTDGPTAVSTATLRNDSTYMTGYALYDGLLRARQTQQPAPGGGRLVNDTFYDARGLVAKSNDDYYTEGSPGTTLWTPASDDDVPGQTVTLYDGMEWATAEIFRKRGTEQWRTTTTYGGDRVSVDPPVGATPITKITDARGRTVEVRQYKGDGPSGAYDATKTTYGANGQPTTVTDAAGSVWRYLYDLRGRVKQVDDPDKGTATLAYDDRTDELLSSTDSRGKSVAFTYDVLGRMTAEYAGTDATGVKLASWTYDTLPDGTVVKGQPTSSTRYVKNSATGGTDAYTSAITGYDNAYRPTGTQTVIPAAEGALQGTYSTTTDYNLDGTVHRTVLPAAGGLLGETMLYDYDELGNPTTTRGLTNYVTSTTYSKLGQLLDMTMSTGGKRVKETNYYEEGTNRLTRSLFERETAPISISDANYSYDASGNINKIADTPSGQSADVQCFKQDYLQRLSEAWTATDGCAASTPSQAIVGGPAPYWQSFSYDVVGNRTKEIDHATTGDVTKTFTYAGAGNPQPHTLTSVAYQGGPRNGQTDTYDYDQTGNTTERGDGRVLEWDVEGHLAKSTDPSGVSTYLYDAGGERLIRRDPTSTTLYVAGMEVRLDTTTGAKTATRYYTHGDQVVACRTNQGVTWLGADNHGSADTSITDNAAQTSDRRRFTPFGQMRGVQPAYWPGERGFVGGTIDTSTALTHLGAREYDAETGRFISVDPVFDNTDPQSWNGYAYSGNNPVTTSDPSGLLRDSGGYVPIPNPKDTGIIGAMSGISVGGGHYIHHIPPATHPKPHCGTWDFGCKAKQVWHDHKGIIVNITVAIVVTVGCEAATGGAGSVGCLAAGGAAGNLAEYMVTKPPDQWSLGGMVKTATVGAVINVAGGALGKAAAAVVGRVATTAAGKVVAGAIGKAAGKAKSAIGKGGAAASEGAEGAAAKGAGKAAGKGGENPRAESGGSGGGCNSFVAGTKVKMADGTLKPIEKIKIGEEVLATDPLTGETTAKAVLATYSGLSYLTLVQVTVDADGKKGNAAGTILTTEHHLFWDAKDHTWVRADELTTTDRLRNPDGKPLPVVAASLRQDHPVVYDITVDKVQTFYVAAADTSVLVHNCPVNWGLPKGPRITVSTNGRLVPAGIKAANRFLGKRLPKGVLSDDSVVRHETLDELTEDHVRTRLGENAIQGARAIEKIDQTHAVDMVHSLLGMFFGAGG
ncbi:polymorphic toxin-type HINT domain-containing protein [Sphaerisporangium corydalis]|uniref:Polymorphic toxin-type HINT domain-containing protein n=1 Tax=Sphaerisporangium corydalis TaxID=1441875 RepID=A0ABV9E8E3_9ACTN|nr:polymorphic toxin-type HINT domain-containing protein [Sphaerisporangium corydalis]